MACQTENQLQEKPMVALKASANAGTKNKFSFQHEESPSERRYSSSFMSNYGHPNRKA